MYWRFDDILEDGLVREQIEALKDHPDLLTDVANRPIARRPSLAPGANVTDKRTLEDHFTGVIRLQEVNALQ
jgi:hypothetical protein